MGGHIGVPKIYKNVKRFHYWSGMLDWICALTADSLTCENNKPKLKHSNEVPLEEWQNETVPFRTCHIDLIGCLHPPSNQNFLCLLVIDVFSRFLWYTLLLPLVPKLQCLPSGNGSICLESLNLLCTTEALLLLTLSSRTGQQNWESLCDLEQHFRPGLTVKSKPRINILPVIGGTFLNDAGSNWSSLASKLAFAHNTSVNSTTGKTHYEVVFGTKPQTPKSLKLGLYRKKHKLCCSDFCKEIPSNSQSENNLKNQLSDNLLRPQN